jgi:hypothetical protein
LSLTNAEENYLKFVANTQEMTETTSMVNNGDEQVSENMQGIGGLVDTTGEVSMVKTDPTSRLFVCTTPEPGFKSLAERPVPIDEFKWQSTDAIGTKLADIRPLLNWYKNNALNSSVFSRVAFLRFKLVLSVKLNSTLMHYGRLVMAWYPSVDGTNDNLYQSMEQMFQLPHIQLNATGAPSGEIEIPFISNLEMLPRDDDTLSDFCRLMIYVSTPLRSVSGVPVPVSATVFAQLKDVEFVGLRTEAQSGTLQKPKSTRPYKKEQARSDAEHDDSSPSVFSVLTDVASTVASVLPGIGSIWSAAKFLFGFEAPPVTDNTLPMQIVTQRIGNIENNAMSTVIGVSQSALLDVIPEAVNDQNNDMLIETFIQREGLLGVVTIDGTEAIDSVITKLHLSPEWMWYGCLTAQNVKPPVRPTTSISYIPLAYMARFFEFWRGSFVLKLSFVASRFHSMRLRVTYAPNVVKSLLPDVTAELGANLQ